MEHRRFLGHSEVHRPFAGSAVFERVGGQQGVDSLIDGLYDRIEANRALRPLFGRDLSNERAAQKRFFTEWLGGAAEYSESAHLPIKHRHDLIPITGALASQWLAHFRAALEHAVPDVAVQAAVFEKVEVFARALVNEAGEPSPLRAKSHGICLRYEPASEAFALVRRGDLPALRELLERAPDVLASAPLSASLLQLATLSGRDAVMALLLDRGVDVNKPAPLEPMIFLTALCAARSKRRQQSEALLLARGALEDVFTNAFLGDLPRLQADLEHNPESAQALDPAVDALQITAVHHAVAGARVEALRALLTVISRSQQPLLAGARALRDAVAQESVVMVGMLLESGAEATAIGAGRWVLHPELAELISNAGGRVDRSGSWIGLSCTGNQGRKDDPEYVSALLRHGARVGDQRLVGQGNDGGRATALHYASKAGFVHTIAVLLERGADPKAPDDNGLTPFDWLERASKSVDRAAVRRLLSAVNSS